MKPRIVFMGTPEFAVPTLQLLHLADCEVVGVVTATDKYGGRNRKQLLEPPVKREAVRLGIPILQPKNLKAADFQSALRALNADLQIVVAFRMLPEAVWNMPRLGTYNLHGSLLPKYRGAAPINWAVINGDTSTGCTVFKITHAIDTGDVLAQREFPIGRNDTAGDVHDRMMLLGAELVRDAVPIIAKGGVSLMKQDGTAATPAPKIFREDCRIDFSRPAESVHNFVRGLSPYPGAWTTMDGLTLKILKTVVQDQAGGSGAGLLYRDGAGHLAITAGGGSLRVVELQLAGRKRMSAEDFLRGNPLSRPIKLGE